MNGLTNGFSLVLTDGSIVDNATTSWTAISERASVSYFSGSKTVMLCTLPVKRVTVSQAGLTQQLDVPEGYRVYQAIRSNMDFNQGSTKSHIIGRCVGLVLDGVVRQEMFLNVPEHEIYGMKL
jgi:hypothetical protein